MRRPYFFEIFSLANLAAIGLLAYESIPIVGSPLSHIFGFSMSLGAQALVGVLIRCAVAYARHDRAYWRIIRSREWLVDTLRLIVFGGVVVTTYGWIKLVIPIYHPRLFDEALWETDRLLFFGMSPTVFFLDLFDGPFLRVIDWSYAKVFLASAIVSFGYFLSHPSHRVRIAFANGNAVLWITGAWLYMLIPSLGPAYRFPDIWMPYAESLQITQTMQAILMRNFRNVIRAAAAQPVTETIRIVFGIGAFPSLHVAFQMYVFLWMRKLWTSGEVLFGIFVLVIFLGSMITGWHYLVDSLVGLLLGYLCYRVCWRRARLERWVELRAR